MNEQINGVLLFDKPINITSNQALQKIKKLFCAKKAGHTGSLDPIATGILPICFGEATKFSQFLLNSNKSYRVVAKLGVETNTGDSEGEILRRSSVLHINETDIKHVLKHFIGEIEQIPPMFSALKHQGKPLYKLARAGIEVERSPRKIKIFSIVFESFIDDEITFNVSCSKGTYIRTLVEDIGKRLKCGAHVIQLRRTQVHPYEEEKSFTLDMITSILHDNTVKLKDCLLPIESALRFLPSISLTDEMVFYVLKGQSIRANSPMVSSFVSLFTKDHQFLGVGEISMEGRLKPYRLLSQKI